MVDPDQAKRVFGRVLRERRLDAGLSQEALADQAGFDRTYISMLERGLRQPSLLSLLAISACLDTNASDLVESVERALR